MKNSHIFLLFLFFLCYQMQLIAQEGFIYLNEAGKCRYIKTYYYPTSWAVRARIFCDCSDFQQRDKKYIAPVAITKGGKRSYGLINNMGRQKIPFQYDHIYLSSGDKIRVQKAAKWGLYDIAGKELLPCEYDNIIIAKDMIAVAKGNEWRILSDKNFAEKTAIYQEIVGISDTLPILLCKKNDLWGMIDLHKNSLPTAYTTLIYYYTKDQLFFAHQTDTLIYNVLTRNFDKSKTPNWIPNYKRDDNIYTIYISGKKDTLFFDFEQYLTNGNNGMPFIPDCGAWERSFFYKHLYKNYINTLKSKNHLPDYQSIHLFRLSKYSPIRDRYFLVLIRGDFKQKRLTLSVMDRYGNLILPIKYYELLHFANDSTLVYKLEKQKKVYLYNLSTQQTIESPAKKELLLEEQTWE